jgi:FG-GAP-like repeat
MNVSRHRRDKRAEHLSKLRDRRVKGRKARGFRPGLEDMEDRTVLSFFTPPTFAVGTGPAGQAVGDFNSDDKADLVVVNQASNTMSVLLGKGDGTFQPKTDYATGTGPTGVAVGDFNGDGKLDIAVANKGANSVSILLGNGDGTFGPKNDIALALTPVALTVGDFNGDGKADLAVATYNATQDSETMLLGNGNGTFQLPVTTVTDTYRFVSNGNDLGLAGTGVSSIQSGDFNGDGHADLVVVNNKDDLEVTARARFGGIISTGVFPAPGSVSVLLGNGDGTLQAPRTFAVGSGAQSVAIGEFNNDGRLDFAVNNFASNSVSVFTNSGNGNFSESGFNFGSGKAGTLAAGDFNGDGVTDLAVGANVLNGQTGTGLQAGASYALPFSAPVAADFNDDGHLDLTGLVGGAIEVWLNKGNGTFPAPIFISGAGVALASQATGDFNGDGIPDLVSASTGQVQLGLGDGRFGDTITLAVPPPPLNRRALTPSRPWTPMATAPWTCW